MLLYIELLLILINVALIAIVYKGQRSYASDLRLLEMSFILFVSSISAWIVIQTSYNYLTDVSQQTIAQLSIDLGLVLSVIASISFWRFLSEFSGRKIAKKRLLGHVIIAILVIASGLALKPVFVYSENSTLVFDQNTMLYGAFTLYLITYFVAGLWALLRKKSKNAPEELAKNKRRLTTGIVSALFFIIIGNVVAPIIDDDSLASNQIAIIFTVFGTTLLSLSSAFSAFNLGAFNYRKFLFRATVGFMAYVLPLIAILYGLSLVVTGLIVNLSVPADSLTARTLYVVGVLVGVATVFIGRKYVSNAISSIFVKNKMSEADFIASIENLVKYEFSDELTTKYAKLCKQFLGADKIIIYVGGKGDSDMSDQKAIGSSKNPIGEDVEITQLYGDIELEGRKRANTSNLIEDIQLTSDVDVSYIIRYEQAELHGAMFLGSKLNGRRYYADEISVVRKGLVEILLAMQNVFRIKQLIEFNKSLEDRITHATKELRHTNEKLKALDEAKDEFISMASHQLRTPLTSIKGYISLILDGDMGKVPSKQRKMLSEAFSSSQRMVYLISDLLNVSRLKTGKFLIEPVPLYLPDVIEEEIDQVKELAEVKNIKIKYQKPKNFTQVNLDDMKIRQVIMNFIDNAIHYTPDEGSILVHLEENASSIQFKVIDSGIGVPKSEQHHLFTKFYRAGNARKARPDGTGLGLFMAKKVIVASGGSLIFNSVEGEGSTFGFSFPKRS